MVSNASDDLPEPDRPVRTISLSRGSSRLMLRRLCSRAPRTTILSATDAKSTGERAFGGRTSAECRRRADGGAAAPVHVERAVVGDDPEVGTQHAHVVAEVGGLGAVHRRLRVEGE